MKQFALPIFLVLAILGPEGKLRAQSGSGDQNIPASGKIDFITFGGLDDNLHIDNSRVLSISWGYTPDIGATMRVEYQLEKNGDWTLIDEVSVDQTTPVQWTTPSSGYYPDALIRLTSSDGESFTSYGFTIGASQGVGSALSSHKYSLGVFPNPSRGVALFEIESAESSTASIVLTDALGRIMMSAGPKRVAAGTNSIVMDLSRLTAGTYCYRLIAGSEQMTGQLVHSALVRQR